MLFNWNFKSTKENKQLNKKLVRKHTFEKKEIKSKDILALAYGRDAANEMKDRVKEKTGEDIEIRTFHSLGRQIVQNFEFLFDHVTLNFPSSIHIP